MNDSPKRVLFVCIGNACRSQMAEAFARAYGSDVVAPASAGLYPADALPANTLRSMSEKNLDLRGHFPKHIRQLGRSQFDLVVNMSGEPLPGKLQAPVRNWEIRDPVALSYEEHCAVRDEIERMVMNLVLELRRERNAPLFRGQGSGRLKL